MVYLFFVHHVLHIAVFFLSLLTHIKKKSCDHFHSFHLQPSIDGRIYICEIRNSTIETLRRGTIHCTMVQFNMEKIFNRLRITNLLVRELLAEFIGIFILMLFGTASVAQSVLSENKSGTMLSINLSWGAAVALGVYASGGVSGGHLNPAVTLALATIGKFKWKKVVPFMCVQYLGSFVAAACTYWVYYDAIAKFGKVVPGTAGIFATYPQEFLSLGNAFVDQIVGTAMLLLTILAITDPRNMEVSKGMVPLAVGVVVTVIGMSLGFNCGYAINPARDLSPRLFTLAASWGTEVITYANYYWWIPIVGPHLGAIIGAWTYQLFVGFHWPPDEEEERKFVDTKVETRF